MEEARHALAAASAALNQQDFHTARQIVEQVRQHLPKHPDVLHLSGYISLAEGKYEEAVKLINQAIRIAPKISLYHYNLGGAHFMHKDFKKARDAFQKAVRLDPASREAVENLAITQHELKRLQEAATLFERAVELAPDDPKAWLNLAKVRMELREPEKVSLAINSAARFADLEDKDYWHEVGKIYNGLGQYVEAERYLRKALQYASEDGGLQFALGTVLATREDYQGAKEAFAKPARKVTYRPPWMSRWPGSRSHRARLRRAVKRC